MLKFKTSCAVLANLSSNLLNEVGSGLSLFRYFEVGLRVCDIVVNKYVRYLISWWVLVKMCEYIRRAGTTVEVKDDTWSMMTGESWSRSTPCHKAAQNGMQVIRAQPSQCAPSWTPATDQSQGSLLCRHWSASVTRTNQNDCLMTIKLVKDLNA